MLTGVGSKVCGLVTWACVSLSNPLLLLKPGCLHSLSQICYTCAPH